MHGYKRCSSVCVVPTMPTMPTVSIYNIYRVYYVYVKVMQVGESPKYQYINYVVWVEISMRGLASAIHQLMNTICYRFSAVCVLFSNLYFVGEC